MAKKLKLKPKRRMKLKLRLGTKPSKPELETPPAATDLRQQELFPEPEASPDVLVPVLTPQQQFDSAEQLRAACRGFRLRFWDLGDQRKLDDGKISRMATQLNMAATQLRVSKKLYTRHPAFTHKNSAKNALNNAFEAVTLPFPEPGVRLYPLKTKIDPNWSVEQIEKVFAEEITRFQADMQRHIDGLTAAVQRLQVVWPEVLESAKQDLRDEFDPRLYPTADQLPELIGCEFSSYNLTLPPEYNFVDPVLRQREMAILQSKFQAAAEKQAEFVQEMLAGSMRQFIDSVKGFGAGRQTNFKTSVVENVFKAVEEFKEKTVRFGVLRDTQIHKVFDDALALMRSGGENPEAAARTLRDSKDVRDRIVRSAEELAQTLITTATTERVRRALLKDQKPLPPEPEPAA